MSSTTKSSGSTKGFLDVKIPARKRKSISLFRVQVWKRKCWVVIRGDRSPAEINTTSGSRSDQVSLSVEIYTQHEGTNYPTEGTILHLDLVHKIRRAKSKSHPYAFEVCGRRGEALLYLSGSSETESQKWMSVIRTILWPEASLDVIQQTYKKTWEVSSISVGDCGAEWTNIGGLYGRLAVFDSNILIKDVHTGSTRTEWPLTSVQRIFVATGGEPEDEGKVFIVQTRQSHPCGETFLYFFSLELSDLLEGLHEAVSGLINKKCEDNASIISDLSELSGALTSVVALPQRVSELNGSSKIRKSTSVLNVSQLDELLENEVPTNGQRLCISQNSLTCDKTNGKSCSDSKTKVLCHFRRRSMSEANITKICLDETDEELEHREEDFEDVDLQHIGVPKDRTSSSGSYNSYRSNDSGVKLSASPNTYGDCARVMKEHSIRKLVSKSDSVDSGVRTGVKDDCKDTHHEPDERRIDGSSLEDKDDRDEGVQNDLDLDAKIGAWCLQSAQARKTHLLKNFSSTCAHRELLKKSGIGLSRTFSESHKENIVKTTSDEYKKAMENPILTKHTTVYEEIVDVLRPLNEKNLEKEHDYEELDKCRKDIRRSYSFHDKSQPPPLPPRRPQSFSPDPWTPTSAHKAGSLKKFFGISFHTKSHSTDSMVDVEKGDLEGRLIPSSLGSDDMAMVQALGTLPRIRRKTTEVKAHRCLSSSPKMSPKQKLKNPFGISPNRSPRIPRPKNLFIFRNSSKEDVISPSTQTAMKLSKQGHPYHTPSTDSSAADISTPETPKQSISRSQWREGSTPDDSSTYSKSPKIVSKTFNFLRKFPKEKHSSLERKRKSAVCPQPVVPDSSKVPNSYSCDNFAIDDDTEKMSDHHYESGELRARAMSMATSSSTSIPIPRKSCCYNRCVASPVGTPTSCSSSFSARLGTPPPTNVAYREDYWNLETRALPPPPPCEPQYANLGPDPDYISVEDLKKPARKNIDDGGYLSMGEIRTMTAASHVPCTTEHHYVAIEDLQTVLRDEFSGYSSTQREDKAKQREAYLRKYPCSSLRRSHHVPMKADEFHEAGYKSAPSSRKPSCCEAADYLTPQEVSRLLRRELVSAGVRDIPYAQSRHFHHSHK